MAKHFTKDEATGIMKRQIDSLIFTNEEFINERTIKELVLNQGLPDRENPNSDKYEICQIDFVKKHESQLNIALKNLKKFEYNDDLDSHKANRYYGPVLDKNEKSVYVGQMNNSIKEGRYKPFYVFRKFYR